MGSPAFAGFERVPVVVNRRDVRDDDAGARGRGVASRQSIRSVRVAGVEQGDIFAAGSAQAGVDR